MRKHECEPTSTAWMLVGLGRRRVGSKSYHPDRVHLQGGSRPNCLPALREYVSPFFLESSKPSPHPTKPHDSISN
jgi:hypothetical protein